MKATRKALSNPASPSPARWITYATAALASGLAGATSVEGEIHYSGRLDIRLNDNHNVPLPLTGAASLRVIHFEHFYGSSSFHDGGSAVLNLLGAYGAIAGVNVGGSVSASRLPARIAISGLPFGVHIGFFAERSNGGGFPDGKFLSPGTGYAAFKFNVGAGDQYGWIRVRTAGLPENNFAVLDYAFGDPGEGVLVGQKSSAAGMANSLGDLAFGGIALRALRGVDAK